MGTGILLERSKLIPRGIKERIIIIPKSCETKRSVERCMAVLASNARVYVPSPPPPQVWEGANGEDGSIIEGRMGLMRSYPIVEDIIRRIISIREERWTNKCNDNQDIVLNINVSPAPILPNHSFLAFISRVCLGC